MAFGQKYAAHEVFMRPYDHKGDFEAVVEVCGGQAVGIEQVPGALSTYYQNDSDHPFVFCVRSKIVAFVNAHIMKQKGEYFGLVYIGSLRVATDEKGKGLGTIAIERVMREMTSHIRTVAKVKFFATTLAISAPVRTVFQKTGWHRHYVAHQWPSLRLLRGLKEGGINNATQVLNGLGISERIPAKVREAVRSWRELVVEEDIARHINKLSEKYKCSEVVLKRYAVDSHQERIEFLQSEWATLEQRSVWVLERESEAPVLLFIREKSVDPTSPFIFCDISAIAIDAEAAEHCVAFLDRCEGLGLYCIAFDPVISEEVLKSSPFLSQVDTSPFLVHRTVRTTSIEQ